MINEPPADQYLPQNSTCWKCGKPLYGIVPCAMCMSDATAEIASLQAQLAKAERDKGLLDGLNIGYVAHVEKLENQLQADQERSERYRVALEQAVIDEHLRHAPPLDGTWRATPTVAECPLWPCKRATTALSVVK